MATLLPNAEQVFLDNNGVPLALGTITFYVPNTSTLKNTWQDAAQTILNTNPIMLDAAGRAIIYGVGEYRTVLKDSLGNTIWDQLTNSTGGTGVINLGFNGFIVSPIAPPANPASGLNLSLPASQIVDYSGNIVNLPAITSTLTDNAIIDYWTNPVGSSSPFLVNTTLVGAGEPPHYANLVHVWQIYTVNGNITQTLQGTNTYPTVTRPTDRALTIDSFNEQLFLYNTLTNWSSTLAVTYGELLLTTTGNVYQVSVAGTTGSVAPTSTAVGGIIDGTATLFYYGQNIFTGMYRYSQNGGIENYFANRQLYKIAHRKLATGSPLSSPAGTYLPTLVKLYLQGMFANLIKNRVNLGTYIQGQKMIAGGYIWLCTTGGATAASSPFSGSYTVNTTTNPTNGSAVTDGTVHWLCIFNSYASQEYFWMNTDRTFIIYAAPDSHDSYYATFASLLARYIHLTHDYIWLTGASNIPSGSGTFYTYQQLFTSLFTNNATGLYTGTPQFLCHVFQNNINPKDGTAYTAYFLEDNCEVYQGAVDSAFIFGLLGDSTNQTNATTLATNVDGGLHAMLDVTYNLFKTEYSIPVSTWVNMPNLPFYPYMEAQFWPEQYNIPSITADTRLDVRYNVSQLFPEWFLDKGKDTFPIMILAYMAATIWQDTSKAYRAIENYERYYIQGGPTIGDEFASYLATKESLEAEDKILNIDQQAGILVANDQYNNVRHIYGQRQLFTINQTSDFSLTIPSNTFITYIIINEVAGHAITGGLDIGTTNGAADIVSAFAVGANSLAVIPDAAILLRIFNLLASQTLFFHAHTSWNSAKIDVEVFYQTAKLYHPTN